MKKEGRKDIRLAVMLIAPIWGTAAAAICVSFCKGFHICLGLIRECNHSTKYLPGRTGNVSK